MSNHSVIEHRANYYYVKLEDDYLAMCTRINQEIESFNLASRQTSGPADCKAMILSVLEHWMNSKKATAHSEDDLYVYLTYDEWEHALRYRYHRSVIIRCLDEMVLEGQALVKDGLGEDEVLAGLIKRKPYRQNTYRYLLHAPVVQAELDRLPAQSPFNPRPKAALGRPRKNRIEINGLNKNGIISDGNTEIPSENTSNNAEYRSKIDDRSSIHRLHYTDLSETQIERCASGDAPPAPSQQENRFDLTEDDCAPDDGADDTVKAPTPRSVTAVTSYSTFGYTNEGEEEGQLDAVDNSGGDPGGNRSACRPGDSGAGGVRLGTVGPPETPLAPSQQTIPATPYGADTVAAGAQAPDDAARTGPPNASESRASSKRGKPPRDAPIIPPEAIAIMDEWDALFKAPQPRTEKHVQAAIALVPSHPTREELKACKAWLFTTDNPQKPWFRRIGVKLQDVANNYGAWQSVAPEQEGEEQEPEPYSIPWFIRNQELRRAGLQA